MTSKDGPVLQYGSHALREEVRARESVYREAVSARYQLRVLRHELVHYGAAAGPSRGRSTQTIARHCVVSSPTTEVLKLARRRYGHPYVGACSAPLSTQSGDSAWTHGQGGRYVLDHSGGESANRKAARVLTPATSTPQASR